jgi:hypothetical protein
MFYLINSSLRAADELIIETYNNIGSNIGNISCKENLLSINDVMVNRLGDILSYTTGEKFVGSIVGNKLNLSSEDCSFKIDYSNINSNNPYNLLGLSQPIYPNLYYSNFIGNGNINNNTPIYQSDIFKLDVLKNSFDGTYQIHPPNYTIENLCIQIEDKLNLYTRLSWNVIYDNSTDTVSIHLNSSKYKFLFFWTNSKFMYNIAVSLGFPIDSQSDNFTSAITAPNKPKIDTLISSNDELFFNIQETQTFTTDMNYGISPGTLNSSSFINNLNNLLNTNTNLVWSVEISNINTNNIMLSADNNYYITIKLLSEGEYTFKLLLSDPLMSRIAMSMGANTTFTDTIFTNNFTFPYPINYNILYSQSDLFKFIVRKSNNNYSYKAYTIPLNKPVYNPVECITQIKNKLVTETGKQWTIQSNTGISINNNSYLKINIYDIDTSFRFFWGNTLTGNLSKSLGFSNVDMTNFSDSIISDNIINFNNNLNFNDRLYFETKSNVYYSLRDITIKTTENEFTLNGYLLTLPQKLLNITNNTYNIYLEPNSEKVYISVNNPDTTFKILFGQKSMINIAKMLGFDAVNSINYTNYIVGDARVDYNITLTSDDIFFMIEKNSNNDNGLLKTIPFYEQYFSVNNFISVLPNLLYESTKKNWTVSNVSNYLTIQVNSPNCSFKILWTEPTMHIVAEALGFDQIDQSNYLNSITGVNTINTNIKFNENNQFIFYFRDTTQTDSQPTPYYYNITLYNSTFEKFLNSFSDILYNLTGKLFRIIVNYLTGIISITVDSSNTSFKIPWNNPDMIQIAQMLGFNQVETSEYTTTTFGENAYNPSITLTNSNIFTINIITKSNINYDVVNKNNLLYIDPNFFYPGYFFNFIYNQIIQDLNYQFSITYDDNTQKITLSSNNRFVINFGNLTNLAEIMGFDFLISPSYELTFTSINKIDMTLSVLTDDILNLKFLKSFSSHEFNFFDFYGNYHKKLLETYLYKNTGLLWECTYDSITKKMSIYLYTNKYIFVTTDPRMKLINIIYGFDSNTLEPYNFTQVSNYQMSFSTIENNQLVYLPTSYDAFEENYTIIYSIQPTNNKIVSYPLPFEPIIYTPSTLKIYLQNILNTTIPGIGFTVTYDITTQKITISNTPSTNIKFRFLFGNTVFIHRLLGFNRSNISEFGNTITSEREINMSGQFGQIIINPNAIIKFNKLRLCNINLPIIENITDSNNVISIIEQNNSNETPYKIKIETGYYKDITDIATQLSNALNQNVLTGTYTVSVSTTTKKMTISVGGTGIAFKIQWNKNKVLSNMCGFNPIETPNFETTITSDFNMDIEYPKVIYLDLYGLKFESQIFNTNRNFLINLNSINTNNLFNVILNTPNNILNKLILTMYDENNHLVSPVSNWNATIEFY